MNLKKKSITILFLPLLMGVLSESRADTAFFTGTEPVLDRSDAQLNVAARSALTRVFVQLSGDENVLHNPEVQAVINDARRRVTLYTYKESEAQLNVYIEFDERFIQDFFRETGLPFWGGKRKAVFLWLILDNASSRRFAGLVEDHELLYKFKNAFKLRGISIRFPLLDLDDAVALSEAMLWDKSLDRIRTASSRYGIDHILIGRWIELSNDEKIADWIFLTPQTEYTAQYQSANVNDLVFSGVDLAVDQMRGEYAVRLRPINEQQAIPVTVSGIESYEDYEDLMSALATLETVASSRVGGVVGGRLILWFEGVDSAQELSRLIKNIRRLDVVGPELETQIYANWRSL